VGEAYTCFAQDHGDVPVKSKHLNDTITHGRGAMKLLARKLPAWRREVGTSTLGGQAGRALRSQAPESILTDLSPNRDGA